MPANASDRALPMRFELRQQAAPCATQCGTLIFASGAIVADTPRAFETFAKGRDLSGAVMALDSDGGSVVGAIAFGRDIRRHAIDTTVGRISDDSGSKAKIAPDADCESMCVFVLLGGAQRYVPPQARVMVHQIWIGDRRNDPTAASYSAEDLSLVQRDVGSLAQYTVDMGASIELLALSLRIPPWERMHLMSRNELRRVALDTSGRLPGKPPATVATTPAVTKVAAAPATDGAPPNTANEQGWTLVDRSNGPVMARRHLLTNEGDEIGSFDLALSCAPNGGGYRVSYIERRRSNALASAKLSSVSLIIGSTSTSLAVVSSRHEAPDLVTEANAILPAKLIANFADAGSHSMLVETEGTDAATAIRVGNTGAMQNLPLLAASCGKIAGKQARLSPQKAPE